MKRSLFYIVALIQFFLCSTILAQERAVNVTSCLKPFYHGVASGDPLTDRVIIWTRVTPDTNQINSIPVTWKIATDTNMINLINAGATQTNASVDFTVKIDVTGLQPNTFYFYQFEANGFKSVIGRTKTAPQGNSDSLRFAVVSCANYEAGYFNVFKSLKQRNDFDAVVFLGDYIYEVANGGYAPNPSVNRQWSPANEIVSLLDYRTRYSSYRLDDDLRNLHQQFPFIVVWDDHETSGNAWENGATNHQTNEGSWAVRKAYAHQAFFEWLPIRVTGTNDPYQIFRDLKYGNLVEFIMLDTRMHGRDQQAGTTGAVVNSSTRQLLGTDQFSWLGNRLDSSDTQWKVIAQQVMMAPLKVFGVAVNGDQWDGYPAERSRVYNHILSNNIQDVVVITGDIHSSWANDLPASNYNSSTGAGSAGVEFIAPSVTSPGSQVALNVNIIKAANSHIKYVDLTKHGYIILDINHDRAQSDWYFVNTIDQPSSAITYATSYYTDHLTRNIKHANSAAVPRNSVFNYQTSSCPSSNIIISAINNYEDNNVIISVYPNPVTEQLYIQYFVADKGQANIKLYDISGKLIQAFDEGNKNRGVYQSTINVESLPEQVYILEINSPGKSVKTKIVKK